MKPRQFICSDTEAKVIQCRFVVPIKSFDHGLRPPQGTWSGLSEPAWLQWSHRRTPDFRSACRIHDVTTSERRIMKGPLSRQIGNSSLGNGKCGAAIM
jgi:hypothetical protein